MCKTDKGFAFSVCIHTAHAIFANHMLRSLAMCIPMQIHNLPFWWISIEIRFEVASFVLLILYDKSYSSHEMFTLLSLLLWPFSILHRRSCRLSYLKMSSRLKFASRNSNPLHKSRIHFVCAKLRSQYQTVRSEYFFFVLLIHCYISFSFGVFSVVRNDIITFIKLKSKSLPFNFFCLVFFSLRLHDNISIHNLVFILTSNKKSNQNESKGITWPPPPPLRSHVYLFSSSSFHLCVCDGFLLLAKL